MEREKKGFRGQEEGKGEMRCGFVCRKLGDERLLTVSWRREKEVREGMCVRQMEG